jgi:cytochrome c biogenesis protein CcmG/thiol:disulfide interchange protein DsbE
VTAIRVAAGAGVLALATVLGWHLTHQDTATAKAVARGRITPAPAFSLDRLEGSGKVTLAALRGKAVVLNFWASDCIPCKREMPQLQRASQRWHGKRVEVVGIDALDFRGAARRFVRDHGITYPIGFDGVGDAVIHYGVNYTPTTFFVDRRGRIVKRILGPMTDAVLDAQIRRALTS